MSLVGYRMQKVNAPARALGTTFIQDMSSGKLTEAKSIVEPGTDPKMLSSFSTTIQGLGPITQMLAVAIPNQPRVGGNVTGTATEVTLSFQTTTGQHTAQVEVVDHPDGTQGVSHWQLNP
jgi:hypothetical protein